LVLLKNISAYQVPQLSNSFIFSSELVKDVSDAKELAGYEVVLQRLVDSTYGQHTSNSAKGKIMTNLGMRPLSGF
jgi:hypothetical protein